MDRDQMRKNKGFRFFTIGRFDTSKLKGLSGFCEKSGTVVEANNGGKDSIIKVPGVKLPKNKK
jgi:hypothetical protein